MPEELIGAGRLGSILQQGYFETMPLLQLAMAEYRLARNASAARNLLDECLGEHADSMLALGLATQAPLDTRKAMQYRDLLMLSICHLLRGDLHSLRDLATSLEINGTSVIDAFDLFTVALLGEGAGIDTTSLRDVSGMKYPPKMKEKYVLWGYDRLLAAVMERNQ